MKKILILGLVTLSASQSSYAESITTVSEGDKAVEYLRYIFGDVVNIIIDKDIPAEPDAVIGAMSEVLNAAMLFFTGMIVTYVSITGLVSTSTDGIILGKGYDSTWVPIRMAIALLLCMPFGAGYAAMQIVVLSVAGNGIGVANSTYHASLAHLHGGGTLYPPAITKDLNRHAYQILLSRVCMHGINLADRHLNIVNIPYIEQSGSSTPLEISASGVTDFPKTGVHRIITQSYDGRYNYTEAGFAWGAAKIGLFSNGEPRHYGRQACGAFSITFPEVDTALGLAPIIRRYQEDLAIALGNLDAALDPIARQIVDMAIGKGAGPAANAINTASNAYKANVRAAIAKAVRDITAARSSHWNNGDPELSGTSATAKEAGFIFAGAWYWNYTRLNGEVQQIIDPNTTFIGPSETALMHNEYALFTDAYSTFVKYIAISDNSGINGNQSNYAEDSPSAMADITFKLATDSYRTALQYTLENPDPLIGLSNLGHHVINIAAMIFIAKQTIGVIAFETGENAKASDLVPAPIALGLSIIGRGIWEIFSLLVMALFAALPFAMALAYYVPAIPLVFWILGITGWFVLVIEAVIAAPIWAASHALPEGDGFVGQRALQGYMVLLSLFLRPTLMLFGLYSSILLMIVMGKIIAFLFVPFMSAMIGPTIVGVIAEIAILALFCILNVVVAHKCFGLIHELPDKVLRYIGGGAENLGEANGESTVGGKFGAIGLFTQKMLSSKEQGNSNKPTDNGQADPSTVNKQMKT